MSKSQVVPPKRFRPAGVVEWVQHSPTPPPVVRPKRSYGSRAAGIRYEARAHEFLSDRFGERYIASPWFKFGEVGVGKARWCQPDGLLFNFEQGQITVVECKLQHTSDAWWQLKWLYLPVLARAFPGTHWKFALVEMTKWYDPATAFPEKVKLRADIRDCVPGEFGCHIWKPR